MLQPKSQTGIPAPLFEKLTDLQPNSPQDDQDLWFQTVDAAAASIRREITRIFDTRLPWPGEYAEARAAAAASGWEGGDRTKTVTSYGVPDLTHLSANSVADRRVMRRLLTEAIRNFEPRLVNPRVVVAADKKGTGLVAEVSGTIRLKRSLEPLTFSVSLEAASAKK